MSRCLAEFFYSLVSVTYMKSRLKSHEFRLLVNKLADTAFGWPFAMLIFLALFGLLFSRIIFTEIGLIIFTAA